MRETVLYYQDRNEQTPGNGSKAAKLKSVLVQMGIRIKNITPDQVLQQVGYLAGLDGFGEQETGELLPEINEEVMLLKNFTDRRIDELLGNLRRAKVPKVELKAIVTPTNSGWTFYKLYQEISEERRTLEEQGKEIKE